jgi:hypothetical protein
MFGLKKKPVAEIAVASPTVSTNAVAPHHSFKLQIKLISLADESRTIRRVEGKLKRAEPYHQHLHETRLSLREHRKDVVACASRETHLAYGFLKGKTYKAIEPKRFTDPNWKEIQRMIQAYGDAPLSDLNAQFEIWKLAAGNPDRRR